MILEDCWFITIYDIPSSDYCVFSSLCWTCSLIIVEFNSSFHTYDYARHFVSACTRILGLEGTPEGVEDQGRLTRVAAVCSHEIYWNIPRTWYSTCYFYLCIMSTVFIWHHLLLMYHNGLAFFFFILNAVPNRYWFRQVHPCSGSLSSQWTH